MRHSHAAAEALRKANSNRFKEWFGTDPTDHKVGDVVAHAINMDLQHLRHLLGSHPISIRMVNETVRRVRKLIDAANHAKVAIPQSVLVATVDVLARAELVIAGKALPHG